MQIDYAFILAAGIGSRMGEIGKKIPKPLWPIFNKKLLELQVDYCLELGIKKIFVNTHYLADDIESFIKSDPKFQDVTLLHEEILLDSGGCVHNFASRGDVGYTGNVLIVNSDQFLLFDKKFIEVACSHLVNARAVLFGIDVDKSEKYNETVIEDDRLIEIKKTDGSYDFVTYSGLGIINLEGLAPIAGPTKFFETVANFKTQNVKMLVPSKYEYWDFGTAELYLKNILEINQLYQEGKKNRMIDFLLKHDVALERGDTFVDNDKKSINLKCAKKFEKSSIVFFDLIQKVEI